MRRGLVCEQATKIARPERFELPTTCFEARRAV